MKRPPLILCESCTGTEGLEIQNTDTRGDKERRNKQRQSKLADKRKTHTWKMKTNMKVFVGVGIVLMAAGMAVAEDYDMRVLSYCKKHVKPDDKCGWVHHEEWKALDMNQFMEGDAIGGWDGTKNKPTTITPYSDSAQDFPSFLSVTCKNEVEVSATFKLTAVEDGAEYGAGLEATFPEVQQVTRCNLGTGQNPEMNDETECVQCSGYDCPLELDTWYTDSLYMNVGDYCTLGPAALPNQADIWVNGGNTVYVTAFNVNEV